MKSSAIGKMKRLFRKKRIFNENGFGIVEVVIVMVIISLLAVFVAPEVGNWRPNIRLKRAARDFYSDMQKAKLHAIKTNRTVNFTITATGAGNCPGGSYIFRDNNATQVTVAQAVLGAGETEGVCLQVFDAGVTGFDTRGGATGAGGNVTFTSTDITRVYLVGQSVAGGVVMEIQ